jgi:hypothetical protein
MHSEWSQRRCFIIFLFNFASECAIYKDSRKPGDIGIEWGKSACGLLIYYGKNMNTM